MGDENLKRNFRSKKELAFLINLIIIFHSLE